MSSIQNFFTLRFYFRRDIEWLDPRLPNWDMGMSGNETRLTRGKPFHVTVYGLELNFCIGLVCLLPRRPSSNIHYYLNDN